MLHSYRSKIFFVTKHAQPIITHKAQIRQDTFTGVQLNTLRIIRTTDNGQTDIQFKYIPPNRNIFEKTQFSFRFTCLFQSSLIIRERGSVSIKKDYKSTRITPIFGFRLVIKNILVDSLICKKHLMQLNAQQNYLQQ
mgnify:CR=1 FL=1